jgi:chromosome partitioning protein
MRILAVGSPKGGVGKTTTAVTLAALAAREFQLRTLLVDADANRSALDWTARAGDAIPVDAVDGRDLTLLRQLRRATGYDLAVIDLPGAREGAFEAILAGDGGPVADLLIVPTEPEVMAVLPVERVIRHEVAPLGLAHLVTLCRVDPQALGRAADYRAQLRTGVIRYVGGLDEGRRTKEVAYCLTRAWHRTGRPPPSWGELLRGHWGA